MTKIINAYHFINFAFMAEHWSVYADWNPWHRQEELFEPYQADLNM